MSQKKPSRVPINRNVKPATVKLLVKLAKKLDTDQGRVLDRAVVALAGESVK